MLLMLIFYLFAILGMMLFKENDAQHFGDIGTTFVTLIRATTLEDSDACEVVALRFDGFDGVELRYVNNKLAPVGEHTDEELWDALSRSGLDAKVD